MFLKEYMLKQYFNAFFIHLQLAKRLAFGNHKKFHSWKDMTNNYYLVKSSFMFILIVCF